MDAAVAVATFLFSQTGIIDRSLFRWTGRSVDESIGLLDVGWPIDRSIGLSIDRSFDE